jgi:hypothetical protein
MGTTMTVVKKVVWGMATIAAVALVATVGAYVGVQRSTAFEMARAHILSLPSTRALGEPVVTRLRPFGYAMKVTDSSGSAEFSLDVKGQNGSGIAHARLKKELGQWNIVDAALVRSAS